MIGAEGERSWKEGGGGAEGEATQMTSAETGSVLGALRNSHTCCRALPFVLSVPKELNYLKQCPHRNVQGNKDFMGLYQRKLNVFSRRSSGNTSLLVRRLSG